MKKTAIFVIVFSIILIGIMTAVYIDKNSWTMEEPSPSGEYKIVQNCTSAFYLGGYKGKIFLEYKGKRVYINDWAPATCYWTSDETFVLSTSLNNNVSFSVFDYIHKP